MGGSSVYGNALLKIHFKHLSRDTSKVLSCGAQSASFSLDRRSSLMRKKPHPQLNKRDTSSAHHLFCCHQPLLAAVPPKNKQGSLSILQETLNRGQHCLFKSKKMFSLPSQVPPDTQRGDGRPSRVWLQIKESQEQVSEAFFAALFSLLLPFKMPRPF